MDVHSADLVRIEVVAALREPRGKRGEIVRGELGDLLLELGSVGMVLDEEPVPRSGEGLAGTARDLDGQLEAHDQRVAPAVLGHPLLPGLVTGGRLGLGMSQDGRRLIEQSPD